MTMYMPTPVGITLYGVYDRGQPNKERIVLRNDFAVNLAEYGLLRGIKVGDRTATPVRDSFFWFGEVELEVPTLIYVYTGPGSMKFTQADGHPAVVFHWGKNETLFNQEILVPIVFRLESA